ncbi:MAG: hypothetical protein ABW252_16655 [Polyangiales bacterium]
MEHLSFVVRAALGLVALALVPPLLLVLWPLVVLASPMLVALLVPVAVIAAVGGR